MTDLGQQQDFNQQGAQYYGQPPMQQQPYGSQPMYVPQQVGYPPQQPLSYPPPQLGVPQVAYPSTYMAQPEPQVFIQQAPPDMGHTGLTMSDVPLKSHDAGASAYGDEHSYGGFVEQKHDQFHEEIHQTLPSVVTCSDVLNWYKEGWAMYIENWIPYTILSIIFMIFWGGSIIADDEAPAWVSSFFSAGGLLTFPLYYGFFIAGTQVHKQKERMLRECNEHHHKVTPQLVDFFRGYFVFFPLLGFSLLLPLIIGVGFILFIVPGLYLLVTLSFVPYVYIEYHKQSAYEVSQYETVSYGFYDSIAHSRRVIHQHFWEVTFFWILGFAIAILGGLTVIGGVIAIPVVSLALVPAFRDLFGFQMTRVADDRCYCCC